ncbi:MAG: alpha/beta hydrolase [Gammaproteobacteria bacterium]|nr:alpha/beta hydrolase [Gammaproteobacteria bacterium]MCP5202468.1 alpha/beta hydrolase [Gammaproteobacteria bacterium]
MVLLAGWVLGCAVLAAQQDALVFRPRVGTGPTPTTRALAFQDLQLTASDGVRLHAWYLPAAGRGRTVLFLHGNAGHLSHRLPTLATLHALGHPVLALDYRGYGTSAGSPSEDGLARDAVAAWQWLTGPHGLAADDVVIYGRSLGGAVAARLAAAVGPHALVLESTFTRLADLARERYPWVPVRWLLRMRFDSVAALAEVHCPVLVAHSPDDEVIPYAHGQALAAHARQGEFVTLRGAHDRAFRRAGAAYHAHLHRFIGALD